ncbi:vomeronasal type-2 receptor 26-like [Dendropsophus ebraccatus]|uniref:vomeronasal type-2 receptor 26-like n=1 Tax=Dendropsophus ebraccatus TaxID=150705 RepID=UPI003831D335
MVITKLVKHFDWTWVGILLSDNDAGENELQILRKYMRENGICVAFIIKPKRNSFPDVQLITEILRTYAESVYVTLAVPGMPKALLSSRVSNQRRSAAQEIFGRMREASGDSGSTRSLCHSSEALPSSRASPIRCSLLGRVLGIPDTASVTNTDCTGEWRRLVDTGNGAQVPVSRCSDHCLPGSRKMARPTSIHTCCYNCVPCSEGEISNKTDSDNCIKCPSEEWPNEMRDRCLPKVLDFISYHNDTMASVFSCVSLFGCLATGSILRIFISYRDTPIVRANNRDLSYLLLVSIILSFLSVFLFLGRPSDVTCRLRETSFGVFFSVAVSSLLAKTVMVCVAFKSTKPGSPWRKWLSVKVPYTIVLLCSSIQVIICVIWLSISPPFQELDTESYPGKIIIQCNEGSDIWFYSMLVYLWFLAAVSFVLAFLVRTLPDTFNEAKYITFSMLVFCSVWIAMIPAYMTTRGKNMVAVEIFAVMASSAGLLGCVFIPKCFIILFKSEMNKKTEVLGQRKK